VDALEVALTLAIDFPANKPQMIKLKTEVEDTLALALAIDHARLVVTNLEQGSVIVIFLILAPLSSSSGVIGHANNDTATTPSPSPSPSNEEALDRLKKQLEDPESPLRKSPVTSSLTTRPEELDPRPLRVKSTVDGWERVEEIGSDSPAVSANGSHEETLGAAKVVGISVGVMGSIAFAVLALWLVRHRRSQTSGRRLSEVDVMETSVLTDPDGQPYIVRYIQRSVSSPSLSLVHDIT
jgi:hypothetical protein